MTPQPFVSVIVATRNRRALLLDLLKSLDAQTYASYEVIVVDDASTDGSWEAIQEYTRTSPLQVTAMRTERASGGPATPRNVALGVAKGDIVAFTDSDCVASANWIAEGVSAFTPATGFVQGRVLPYMHDVVTAFHTTNTVETATGDSCNIFYLGKAIREAGGFSDAFLGGRPSRFSMYGDDIDLAYRVKEAGYEGAFAASALVWHRVVPQTPLQWLLRARSALTGPFLVRRHPRLRRELLFLRYFVSPWTAMFDLLVLGVLLAAVSPWFLLLGVPFLVAKYRDGGAHCNPAMRFVRMAGASVRCVVTFGALLYGSVRARTLLI